MRMKRKITFLLLLCLLFCGLNSILAQNTFTGTGNWNTPARWSAGTVPVAADNVIIDGVCTINVNATCNSLVINATRSLTNSTFDLTVATTTNNAGTFLDNNNGGVNRFTGLVTNSGTWTSTAITTSANMNFRGGITNTGTFNGGDASFTTSNQTLTGILSFLGDVRIANNVIITNNGTVTIGTSLDGGNAGSIWRQGMSSTLNYGGTAQPMDTGVLDASTNCPNTVNYNRAGNQDIKAGDYCNLITSGSGIKTLQGTTTVAGTLSVNAGTFETAAQNLTVTGTTTVAGTFNDNSNTGVNTFIGAVTNTGTWTTTTSTTTGNLVFRNGITNSGTFNAGGATFNTNSQALAGANAMSFANNVAITGAITVTNNNTNTVTITGNLDGSVAGSTWTQAAGSTLNYGGATQPMNTGVLNANANCNTVNYNAAGAQGVEGATYCNLSITGDNTKTLQGATTVTGVLAITNTLITTAPTLELGTQNITVSGTTNISGTAVDNYAAYAVGNGALLNDNNATGTNIFTGLVTVNVNGNWNTNTAGANVTFGGGILNNGRSFETNTVTFNATQSLTGGGIMNFRGNVTINAGVTVTNGSLTPNSGGFIRAFGTIEGVTGTAAWVNIGSLKYDNGAALMSVGTFTASADYNSVDYICACAQVVRDIDYYNLLTTNSTKTMSPTTTRNINGMLTVRNSTFTVNAIKLEVKLASIGTNATFVNATTATAGTTTNFNQNSAFTGKFNVISASNDNDSYLYSNSGSDIVMQRGTGGGVYAVKTTNFTTAPTQFVAQFEIEAKSRNNDNNAATLLLGDAFTNDLTRNAATARLQFNFSGTTTGYSVTHPDGGAATSTVQTSRQTVTWVVNRGAGIYNYTDPLGATNTVAANRVDVWVGTTLLVNDVTMQNAATPVNDIKLIYDTSTASGAFVEKQTLTISNLRFYLTPPTNISGIINRYTGVTAMNVARTQLTVASTTGFVAGNRVMVIQMKNATINTADAATYGDITAYNNAGRFEFARIASVAGGVGGTVNLTSPLVNTYDAAVANASVQLIYVPEYTDIIVDGLLTAQSWNPTTRTGGVLALAASGTITLQADVDVTGLGFKGGVISGGDGSCRVGIYRNADTNYGQKGEGIATDANNRGRGKLANGGGGGNPHNSGGGGGGNFGKGANGARQWNCAGGGDANNDCTDPTPPLAAPNTEQNSGIGGAILDYTTGRIFLGGGGGSGQQNDGFGTSGADGGGIIVMLANAIEGNGFLMSAKGQSVLATAGNDAGGGGGAGGAIFLDTRNYGTTPLRVNVQGGKGGDVDFSSCHGNGGGGGGGVLRLQVTPTPSNITVIRGGGPSSRNADNSDCALTANSFFCAEATGTGGVIFNNISILPVTITKFDARKVGNSQSLLEWTTSQEINSQYTEIARSTNGIDFTVIGSVDAKGNSTVAHNYSFLDVSPKVGLNYYRLKFVDKDGTFTYSRIVVLEFEAQNSNAITVYPNPSGTDSFFISLQYKITDNTNISVKLVDMLGRIVETKLERTSSQNTFQVFPQSNNLAKGVYVVQIFTETDKFVQKIVLQ
jgi:hypothetical protein